MGGEQLLILLGPARHDHGNLVRQPPHELVETFGEMLSEPGRDLVEPIENERVSAGANERVSDSGLTDLIAYLGAQVVYEEGFEVVLGFPRRQVDQERYSFVAFGRVQVLDQRVCGRCLARAGFADDEEASLGGLESGDDARGLLGDGFGLDEARVSYPPHTRGYIEVELLQRSRDQSLLRAP
jgi:hypothetical protein